MMEGDGFNDGGWRILRGITWFIGQWRGVSRQQQSYKGGGGLQKVINFSFHYSFPVVSFIFNCND